MDLPHNPEETLFDAARALKDPEQRAAFLAVACRNDPDLRQRVERLLSDAAAAEQFFRAAVPEELGKTITESETVVSTSLAEGPGTQIGKYKLLQQIGEGGMGVVYMAEQHEPFDKRVALKIIKLGMDTKAVVARFEAERQALALMNHPNIAKVLDAGATETGRPFFVMELVKGMPITEYCDKQKLNTKERLELFIPVCHAIQHAHQKGIIHRDIKPSNVLVALFDGRPVPMVIDFGIAKATNQRLTQQTVFTNLGQWIGTPAYMSPEQAEGSQLDIDTRSDVYSLGVLLYELLTGAQPFPEKRLRSAGFKEMQRIIIEEDPPRPSTRFSTMTEDEQSKVGGTHGERPGRISLLLRRELDWIVMACLEKDRNRRYETANGLAMDISRYLKGDAPERGPRTWSYQLSKLARKHKKTFAMAAVIAVVLASAAVFSTVQWRKTQAAEEVATKRADKLAAINGWMNHDLLPLVNPWTAKDSGQDPSIDIKLKDAILASALHLSEDFDGHPEIEGEIRLTIGTALKSLGMTKQAEENLRRAVELLNSAVGADDTNTLKAELNLGTILDPKSVEARELLEGVSARSQTTLGPDHPLTLESMVELGANYTVSDKIEMAEVLFDDLASRFALASSKEPALPLNLRIRYLFQLEVLRDWQFRLAEERQISIRLLQLIESRPDSASTAGISRIHRLVAEGEKAAWAVFWDHDFERAEEILKRSLEESRLVVGDGFPTGGFLRDLARIQESNPAGDPEKFIHYRRLQAEHFLRVLGDSKSGEAIAVLRSVSGYYLSRLDWEGAAAELKRQRTELGVEDGVLLAVESLANHLAGNGNQAIAQRHEYFDLLSKRLAAGSAAKWRIDPANRSALHPIMSFPCSDAELQLLIRAVPVAVQWFTNSSDWEQVVPVTEGMLAFRRGESEKAIKLLEPAMVIAGKSHVNRGAHYVLAMAYEKSGRHAEAVKRFQLAESQFPKVMAHRPNPDAYPWESVAMAMVLREEAYRTIRPPGPLATYSKATAEARWETWREILQLIKAGELHARRREFMSASTNFAAAINHPEFQWDTVNYIWDPFAFKAFAVAWARRDAETHIEILRRMHEGLDAGETTWLYQLAEVPWNLSLDLETRRQRSAERKRLETAWADPVARQKLAYSDVQILGMCWYREGGVENYRRCLDAFKGLLTRTEMNPQTVAKTYSAMAHWHLGDKNEARRLLNEADARFFKTAIDPGGGMYSPGFPACIMQEMTIKEADDLIDPGVVNAPHVAALPKEGW